MDIPISDLLDTLQEVDLDLPPTVRVPGDRIEELTMKKLHNYEKKRGRGLSFVTKVLVAAILIASLAIPVMAAGGFTFKDWLIEPEREQTPETAPVQEAETAPSRDIEMDLIVGAESRNWFTNSHIFFTAAENVTATGLTFVCEEYGDALPYGTLAASDGYWIEKWDGTQFLPIQGRYEGTQLIPVENDTAYRWEINWEDVYGTLDSGAYRLYKEFTYTSPEGKTEIISTNVWFRVYSEDMAPYVTQATTALDALLNRHSYHLTEITYDTHDMDYDYCTTEVWKSGNNYLGETRYCLNDGTVLSKNGFMLRDGVGYILDWSGDGVTTDVCFWERADYLQPNNFTLWEGSLSIFEARLGQVYVEEDTVYFYDYSDWMDETVMTPEEIEYWDKFNPTWNHDYHELAYRFDENGDITGITKTYMRTLDPTTSDPFVARSVEVHDTDPEEIAEIINMQDVSKPNVFSWEADRTGHYTKLAQFEGFVNTNPISAITSAQDAIKRAKAEAIPEENPKYRDGYNYNMTNVWHDPDAGIWKVRFYHSQDSYFQAIVWMNDHGITQMKSLSSYEEFN